ncbi:noncanonical pyrimidine nucleotidase, YjjG family [Paenibacillus rhizovicinus]|uniref:Noncanonical pyrimidine nucleotidase, YjjG family n=1 Tax=Paenibacillus rhizovicinus TaxID=2704463 RepID=A0A6C0NU57_9BACL|nr:YjjG family noncanonical pyrimidine nucleotidase [Paenibacillus rhizovicinus]QHW29697.1 noncanonical pyrimidine nucleotidase, YjjG family [Paenibacillus rhizovicinus]
MTYSILLFDLDDTLLDFGKKETESLTDLFQHYGYTYSDDVLQHYKSVNKQLWTDYENGSIPLDVVLNTRFSATLSRLGQDVDGLEWENRYRDLLGGGTHILIDGAMEVCQRLSVTHRLFVITNGITRTQINRLQLTGLHDYFEAIFDSQRIGHQKPSTAFFDYVRHHIPGFEREKALVIGDSLHTDIKGGLQSGIDTCWFNRTSQLNPPSIPSTYTISNLSELIGICGSGSGSGDY